jgi:uncharacterized membrane protein
MKKERLNAITDGVFAIFITIVVLGIKIKSISIFVAELLNFNKKVVQKHGTHLKI